MADLVGQREAPARRGLVRSQDDPPLGRDEQARAVELFVLLDVEAEQVLGDRLDRDGQVRGGEGRMEPVPKGVGARIRDGARHDSCF